MPSDDCNPPTQRSEDEPSEDFPRDPELFRPKPKRVHVHVNKYDDVSILARHPMADEAQLITLRKGDLLDLADKIDEAVEEVYGDAE